MHVHGSYREIVPPRRLVFSWVIESPDEHAGIDSEVRILIAPHLGGTFLTIAHERLDRPGAVERHTAGWMGALNRLESLVRAEVMGSESTGLALVRTAFQAVASVREIKMFGGTAFMVNGHMTVAVSPRGLLVRVGPEEHDEAVKKPGVQAMEMRSRVMTGYVYVDPVPSDARVVHAWVQSALRHNRTLPPKKAARARAAAPKKRKTMRRTRS
jgi:TfoX/Sxy family transcriptional regulator of competence genes